MSGRETVYDGDSYTLKALGDSHPDDYALRHSGLYVEFSTVTWADCVWVLSAHDGGYASVRHSTSEEGDIPHELHDILTGIRDEQTTERPLA